VSLLVFVIKNRAVEDADEKEDENDFVAASWRCVVAESLT